MSLCLNCNNKLQGSQQRYCSNKCQSDFVYHEYINQWKVGTFDGGRGIITRNISGHLMRYLREKYQKCSLCNWDVKHPVTGRVPLEVDHIDGNAENNQEMNLRLICPNCHSLTSNFRNLNLGKGRAWRKMKYIKSN